MTQESAVVGIGEAARLLGWSRDTLRRWADEGVFPAGAIELSPGGHRRFRVEIIQRWAQKRAKWKAKSNCNRSMSGQQQTRHFRQSTRESRQRHES